MWRKGNMTDLGLDSSGIAYAINDRSEIAGTYRIGNTPSSVFLWRNGVVTDLGTLGGPGYHTVVTGINNRTQLVGWSSTLQGATHAFLWEDGVMKDLGTLAGT